ncbi:MAG: DUF1904 domain-containing protein [Bacillota bacterium]
MPHIRFRALNSEQVATLSKTLLTDLASIIQTSEDNFTFELVQTQFFTQGQVSDGYPFVEVLWFERTPEVQQRVATLITENIKELIATDVAVVFQPLLQTNYFENGQHF